MPAPMTVACPHCKTPLAVPAKHVGAPIQCAKCKKTFALRLTTFSKTPGAAASRLPGVLRLDIGSATSPGKVRERNEDGFLVQHLAWVTLEERHEVAVLVVADGMGGYEAGDQASKIVVNNVNLALGPLLTGGLAGQFKDCPAQMLTEAIGYALKEANGSVYRKAKTLAHLKGMGATAAVVLIWDGEAIIGHVGDTRVYHYHSGRLDQVTRDQTLVARMVELGHLKPEEALTHPSRNEVAQAVGKRAEIEPAFHTVRLAPGDWLIAACDGLHAHVDAATLQETIARAAPAAADLADRLVAMADDRGGSDNTTVIAVRGF